MTVLHLVLFRFKPDTNSTATQEILQEFLSLKGKCKNPTSQDLYIKNITGGTNCSSEDEDFTHFVLLEFDSMQHREFYRTVDPVHAEFASRIKPMLDFLKISAIQQSGFQVL